MIFAGIFIIIYLIYYDIYKKGVLRYSNQINNDEVLDIRTIDSFI